MPANVTVQWNYIRVRDTLLNVDSTAEVTITLPLEPGSRVVELVKFAMDVTGGTGATFTPRLGQAAAAGWVNGDIEEAMTYGATPVATVINEVFAVPRPVFTDANLRVYFRPGFDAQADNDATYEFWFRVAVGKSKAAA